MSAATHWKALNSNDSIHIEAEIFWRLACDQTWRAEWRIATSQKKKNNYALTKPSSVERFPSQQLVNTGSKQYRTHYQLLLKFVKMAYRPIAQVARVQTLRTTTVKILYLGTRDRANGVKNRFEFQFSQLVRRPRCRTNSALKGIEICRRMRAPLIKTNFLLSVLTEICASTDDQTMVLSSHH